MINKIIEDEFIHVINDLFGLVIHQNQIEGLRSALLDACQEFHMQPIEILQQLKGSRKSPVVDFLIARLTVAETYFFRDRNQMNLLKNALLPRLIKEKELAGKRELRIWSAGCSSGEEIYTVAILLCEMLGNMGGWEISLLGTDINRKGLKKGEEGLYSEWSMRSIPADYRQRYFTKRGNYYELSPLIRKMVKFDYANLIDNFKFNDLDLIVCRNVLIYLDSGHVSQVIKNLISCLVPKGIILFGASDLVNAEENDLILHHEEEAIYFSLANNLRVDL